MSLCIYVYRYRWQTKQIQLWICLIAYMADSNFRSFLDLIYMRTYDQNTHILWTKEKNVLCELFKEVTNSEVGYWAKRVLLLILMPILMLF